MGVGSDFVRRRQVDHHCGGTEEQKARFLPAMAAGDLRVSLSMTEPGGGTDVLGAMRTFADKVDGGWLLNGEKMWTTGAKAADRLLVLAAAIARPLKSITA